MEDDPKGRITTALLLSPMLGGAIAGLGAIALAGGEAALSDDLRYFLSLETLLSIPFKVLYAAAAGGILGIPAMIAVGLPLHALFMRLRVHLPWAYIVPGVLAGAAIGVMAVYFDLASFVDRFSSDQSPVSEAPTKWRDIRILLVAAVGGASSAWAFWHIRRPDRDATANPPTSAA